MPKKSRFTTKGKLNNGELLLNHVVELIEFGLVALLGLMPLIVIHFTYRRPTRDKPRLSQRVIRLTSVIKTSLLMFAADWLSNLQIIV